MSGTAKPTAPAMNSALPDQVKARMPPRMPTAATNRVTSSTASQKDTGRKIEATTAAMLISAASSSVVGTTCATLAVMRSWRDRNR